ncbi:MAG: TRAP transporter large permease [Clostridia bacterium]|jgi:C4-dicarboxylate transporter DctM subunit|nr:TRAP transporter large permease [Clostridia bacterium]
MMSLIMAIVFFITLFMGMPIFVCLLIGCIVPFFVVGDIPMFVLAQRLFTSIDSYSLMAIPFFMIAGSLLSKGGVSKRLVDLADAVVGWLPGGLAIVTFLASGFFGAISGSSVATVAAIGSIMVPAMLAAGYDKYFTLATVASAGYLGIIVPPSIPLVLYGLAANTSVSELFMGGFIPAMMLIIAQGIYCIYYGKKVKVKQTPFTLRNTWDSFKKSILALLMPIIILGGIYSGVFTTTEAAAVAVLYGLIIGVFVYREINFKTFYEIMKDAVVNSSVLMMIVAGATIVGFIMTREQIPMMVSQAMISISESPVVFMFLANILLIIFGTFMDAAPAITIMAPILAPSLGPYGIDSVAFGVIMVVNLGIGMITPPVGLNLNVAASLANEPLDVTMNKHLWIYMTLAILAMIVMMVFPQVVTFLPNLLIK